MNNREECEGLEGMGAVVWLVFSSVFVLILTVTVSLFLQEAGAPNPFH